MLLTYEQQEMLMSKFAQYIYNRIIDTTPIVPRPFTFNDVGYQYSRSAGPNQEGINQEGDFFKFEEGKRVYDSLGLELAYENTGWYGYGEQVVKLIKKELGDLAHLFNYKVSNMPKHISEDGKLKRINIELNTPFYRIINDEIKDLAISLLTLKKYNI